MRILRPATLWFHGLMALILGVGGAVVGARATPLGAWLGLVPVAVVAFVALRRPLRRWRTARRALPEADRQWLEDHVPLFAHLDAAGRRRFERDVLFLLDEWTFEGAGGAEATPTRSLAVAAGGALLLHGRPDWELPSRHTVLFYPDSFGGDYLADDEADYDGMAHAQGPVILSTRALDKSWAFHGNGENVVLHELAHLLDYDQAFADGTPSLLDPRSEAAWRDLVRREMRRARIGRSLLRRYAATNAAEFFAVAVENFFDRPDALANRHPDLFDALAAFFRLDPRAGKTFAETAKRAPAEDPG